MALDGYHITFPPINIIFDIGVVNWRAFLVSNMQSKPVTLELMCVPCTIVFFYSCLISSCDIGELLPLFSVFTCCLG